MATRAFAQLVHITHAAGLELRLVGVEQHIADGDHEATVGLKPETWRSGSDAPSGLNASDTTSVVLTTPQGLSSPSLTIAVR